jgi:hypothetical protein
MHRALNIALALFVVASWAYLMDYMAGKEEEEAISSQVFVARQICGENAGYEWRGEELTCYSKHGRKASKQVVAAK